MLILIMQEEREASNFFLQAVSDIVAMPREEAATESIRKEIPELAKRKNIRSRSKEEVTTRFLWNS